MIKVLISKGCIAQETVQKFMKLIEMMLHYIIFLYIKYFISNCVEHSAVFHGTFHASNLKG